MGMPPVTFESLQLATNTGVLHYAILWEFSSKYFLRHSAAVEISNKLQLPDNLTTARALPVHIII